MSILSSLFGGGEPNAPLIDLMARLAVGPTPELEGEFFALLARSSLRVAVPGAEAQGLPAGDTAAGPEGVSVRFLGTLDPEGRRSMLAFTGPRAVLEWRPAGSDTVETEFPELCALALSADLESVMIDAGSPHCGLVLRTDLEVFAQGGVPLVAGLCRPESLEGASIVLSPCPQPPPQALRDALGEEAAAHGAIRRFRGCSARRGSHARIQF